MPSRNKERGERLEGKAHGDLYFLGIELSSKNPPSHALESIGTYVIQQLQQRHSHLGHPSIGDSELPFFD